MKIRRIALMLVFAVVPLMAVSHASADTGFRFGPWLYFAPYYFPSSGSCMGICFTPAHFIPRYESPNPPAPGPYAGPAAVPHPPKKGMPRKGFPRPFHSEQYGPPGVAGAPPPTIGRPVPVNSVGHWLAQDNHAGAVPVALPPAMPVQPGGF